MRGRETTAAGRQFWRRSGSVDVVPSAVPATHDGCRRMAMTLPLLKFARNLARWACAALNPLRMQNGFTAR
jgi:hypothetical protein